LKSRIKSRISRTAAYVSTHARFTPKAAIDGRVRNSRKRPYPPFLPALRKVAEGASSHNWKLLLFAEPGVVARPTLLERDALPVQRAPLWPALSDHAACVTEG
jgi:hypothetical protein